MSGIGMLAILCLHANISQATLLAPGGLALPVAGEPDPIGGTVLNSITSSFSTASFTGDLVSSVIAGDASNPFGGLTFTYQYTISSGPDSSGGISLGGFSGFATDVSYQIPATDVIPVLATRSVTGDNIDFTFAPQVTPGQTTALLVVQTDSQVFDFGTSTVLDHTGSANISILTPTAVPEPMSIGITMLGLATLAGFNHLRAKRS
jgi:hypothetical protein